MAPGQIPDAYGSNSSGIYNYSGFDFKDPFSAKRISFRTTSWNDVPTGVQTITFPTQDGKLALTSDIPKMFTYTTSGDGSEEFYVPYGLTYTPTMVLVTANSLGATGAYNAVIVGSMVRIQYTSTPPSGTNNLTWTILVK